jgi:hypothetical protein
VHHKTIIAEIRASLTLFSDAEAYLGRSNSVDLLSEWYARYGEREVSLAEIRKENLDNPVYEALLKDKKWDGSHVQWLLGRLKGQVCDGLRLERLSGRSRYRVTKVRNQADLFPKKAAPLRPVFVPSSC